MAVQAGFTSHAGVLCSRLTHITAAASAGTGFASQIATSRLSPLSHAAHGPFRSANPLGCGLVHMQVGSFVDFHHAHPDSV